MMIVFFVFVEGVVEGCIVEVWVFVMSVNFGLGFDMLGFVLSVYDMF